MQIIVDLENSDRCVRIGSELDDRIWHQLIELFRRNSTLACLIEDTKGIDPTIICHELNVDPSHRLVNQKRRKLRPQRTRAVNDKVERLLGAGSIIDVKYPEWLANPIVVKKEKR